MQLSIDKGTQSKALAAELNLYIKGMTIMTDCLQRFESDIYQKRGDAGRPSHKGKKRQATVQRLINGKISGQEEV